MRSSRRCPHEPTGTFRQHICRKHRLDARIGGEKRRGLRPIRARCASIDIALSDGTALTRAERGTTVAAATITAVSILRQLNVRRGSIEPALLREVEASAAVTVAARLFVIIVRAIIERIRSTSTTVKRV